MPLDLENVEGITGMAKKKKPKLGDEGITPNQVNPEQVSIHKDNLTLLRKE